MEVFPGVSMDPDIRFGKPCLSGTRIDVATIVGAVAAGESADTVAAEIRAEPRTGPRRAGVRSARRSAPPASRSSRIVKVLLDENFPLGLVRALELDGVEVEHIITLGWRGASDTRIRTRLSSPDVLFLTQDEDFLFGESVASIVVVSRVRQARQLTERIEVWRRAVGELVRTPQSVRLFELTNEGVLMPWRDATQKGEGLDD